MPRLRAVRYGNNDYPPGIRAEIEEVAGHFDVGRISPCGRYSLHTEYSYGMRKFDRPIIGRFPVIKAANKDGIPRLWFGPDWASSFARYVVELTRRNPPLK